MLPILTWFNERYIYRYPNDITMGLIAEVLLLVTTVAIAGTVESEVRGDNSYCVCVCVCEF